MRPSRRERRATAPDQCTAERGSITRRITTRRTATPRAISRASRYLWCVFDDRVQPPDNAAHAELSPREREVLSWAQQGKTYWEIGSILGISERTVKFHVARIKTKLDVVSTAHAIAKAMRAGLIS
jgi:DNA-binding CsgD family transcriptional regulator